MDPCVCFGFDWFKHIEIEVILRMDNWVGKRVVVLGAKETGIKSAIFLRKKGAEVFLSELKSGKDFIETKKTLDRYQIESEFGQHTLDEILNSDLIILSPGIPPAAPVYQQIMRSNVPIWSEIELAYRFCPATLIAVTGSNGKTTVTALIRDVLQAAGKVAVSCGNIGNSFIGEIEKMTSESFAVVEVSSFQLVHIDQFRPHVAVLLNLSPNHLDWHKSLNEYTEAKCRIFRNQAENNFAVLNSADPVCVEWARKIKSRALFFDGRERDNPNFAAIEKVASIFQIDPKTVETALSAFSGLEHRFEEVGDLHGVHYINDSKSTTIASLGWALERVGENATLIAGGRHKGGDFRVLRHLIKQKVRFLILIGEAKKEIENSFSDLVSTYTASSLEEALRVARSVSKPGETVLFSPACASFDMFQDYQDRGHQFKSIVSSWRDEVASLSAR